MTSTNRSKTVVELKEELKQFGAPTHGRKENLIERLAAYERNSGFSNTPVILHPSTLPDWPSVGFEQITNDHQNVIPQLCIESIEEYFITRQLKDSLPSGDIKSIDKGRDLLKSKRVQAISIKQQGTAVYFTGMVAAAMKKKVSYSFKLKVHSEGRLLNSDCECPAGKGPSSTCKHIACVALLLSEFQSDGKVLTKKTCTEVLQTFHQPKRVYRGPPPKIEDLKPAPPKKLEDPREQPNHINNPGYSDMVRNMLINYKAQTGNNLSLLSSTSPGKADLQSAASDHPYCSKPLTHYMVDRMVAVTATEAQVIEKYTRKQSLSHRWSQERRNRLTASNFGQICKMTERRDLVKLCDYLYGSKKFTSAATEHGLRQEGVARKMFEEQEGVEVKLSGLIVNPEYSFLGASPDGFLGTDQIVEIKCPYAGKAEKIKPGRFFPWLCMESGKLSLIKHANFYYQVQGQMFLTGRHACKFIVYTDVDLKVIDVHYDDHFCMNTLLPPLSHFYATHYKPFLASKL